MRHRARCSRDRRRRVHIQAVRSHRHSEGSQLSSLRCIVLKSCNCRCLNRPRHRFRHQRCQSSHPRSGALLRCTYYCRQSQPPTTRLYLQHQSHRSHHRSPEERHPHSEGLGHCMCHCRPQTQSMRLCSRLRHHRAQTLGSPHPHSADWDRCTWYCSLESQCSLQYCHRLHHTPHRRYCRLYHRHSVAPCHCSLRCSELQVTSHRSWRHRRRRLPSSARPHHHRCSD